MNILDLGDFGGGGGYCMQGWIFFQFIKYLINKENSDEYFRPGWLWWWWMVLHAREDIFFNLSNI